MTILVTGAAGFIGAHLCRALLNRGERVLGIDSLNDYYDPNLKRDRRDTLIVPPTPTAFRFIHGDLANATTIAEIFAAEKIDRVIHLAAQAGVRYSLEQPQAYVEANLAAFVNLIEACRSAAIDHFVYASSSSVYGNNQKRPFSVNDRTDQPISLYAATKKANELIAHAYCHLYRLPMTGLRFFTVYGPWGRPDMAPFIFTQRIFNAQPLQLFNNGRHIRDITYIDDCIAAILLALDAGPVDSSRAQQDDLFFRIYNIGSGRGIVITDLAAAIAHAAGREAQQIMLPIQNVDVEATLSDPADFPPGAEKLTITPLSEGAERLVRWYRDYYAIG